MKKSKITVLNFQSSEEVEKQEIKNTPSVTDDWDMIFLILSAASLLIGFIYIQENNTKLILFIIAGILHGFYYGKNNNLIFHRPRKNDPPSEDNSKAKTNTYWVHMICGIAGTIALYFLSSHINFACPTITICSLGWPDFTLFVIAILGYTGLLPMTLWFFANSGKILEGLIKR